MATGSKGKVSIPGLNGPGWAAGGTTHLSDGVQQFAVGVEDDAERQQQAEREQADDVGDVVGRLGPPVHRAGGAGTLWAIPAPAQ